ncbi:MAG: acyl-CoA dehydrogenase [Deltaproteobacteria bacterium]|nr:MAG: acyl-CoA dehydrogenase [Deltaproteobacteria bacterium]
MDREELQMVLDTIQSFAKRKLDLDFRLECDKTDRCPENVIRELLGPEIGLHLAFIPTAYGGLGGGATDIFRISETVASIDLGIATSLLGVSLGTDPIRVGGTEEQRKKWMGKVAEHGLVVAYAVTEPSAGSDLAHIKTRATPIEENGKVVAYKINGSKQFITNGSIADLYTVLAVAPGGPSFFVVERGTPGLEPGRPEEKHGIRASNTAPLTLDDVVVPAENLLGGVEGQGLRQAAMVFGYTRVMVASFGLGAGCAALEKAIQYGRERYQGGSLLCEKPAWTHKLIVPHAVALEASRAFIESVASRLDKGEEGLEVEGAIAKMTATECGNAAAEAAIQAHGGYGYIHAFEVEKIKRDVRITCIYEGTTEICQRTVAQDRWRKHLMTQGGYYRERAEGLRKLAEEAPNSGAELVSRSARALSEIMEVCRQKRLTRNQHVLFTLGLLCARVEVAEQFCRKAASGDPATARFAPKAIDACARLWARRVAQEVTNEGLALLAGSGALSGQGLSSFLGLIDLEGVHQGLAGYLDDMDRVAKAIYEE